MSLLYADSSALARAYFSDEDEHANLRAMLLEGKEPVVTSEIARLELASAVRAAASGRRLGRFSDLLARIDADFAEGGRIGPIDLRSDVILPAAYRLVLAHGLRTLDAIHLAVCVEDCPAFAGDATIVFVTRDRDQTAAARTLGLDVR